MRIFGINFETKKELKKERDVLVDLLEEANADILDLEDAFEDLAAQFPFPLGYTVYEVQLKNKNGKFTTAKPSKERSVIIPTVVTEKDYFRLAKKYENGVFLELDEAEAYLDEICSNESTEA